MSRSVVAVEIILSKSIGYFTRRLLNEFFFRLMRSESSASRTSAMVIIGSEYVTDILLRTEGSRLWKYFDSAGIRQLWAGVPIISADSLLGGGYGTMWSWL
jgi:hypothetical protein